MTTIDTVAAQIATPITFLPGALSAQAPGHFRSEFQQVRFTVQAEAGQRMIVNVIPRTPTLGTQGLVGFPKGHAIAAPGGVVMDQVLQESGTYTILAGQYAMASDLSEGDLLVEVILLPPYLLDRQ